MSPIYFSPLTTLWWHFLIQTPIWNLESIRKTLIWLKTATLRPCSSLNVHFSLVLKSHVHVHNMSKTQLPLFTSSQKLLCTGNLRGRHRYMKRMLEDFTIQEELLAVSCSFLWLRTWCWRCHFNSIWTGSSSGILGRHHAGRFETCVFTWVHTVRALPCCSSPPTGVKRSATRAKNRRQIVGARKLALEVSLWTCKDARRDVSPIPPWYLAS